MIKLTFYTTEGCHLCEQAHNLLSQLDSASIQLNIIDIALDDKLVEQYGQSIPVIGLADQRELNWPFSLQDIQAFIK